MNSYVIKMPLHFPPPPPPPPSYTRPSRTICPRYPRLQCCSACLCCRLSVSYRQPPSPHCVLFPTPSPAPLSPPSLLSYFFPGRSLLCHSLSLSPSLCLNLLLRPSRQAHSDHIPHTTRTGRIRTLNVCLAPESVHPELITARHMTNNRHV